MIKIEDNDLPITAAQKIICGVKPVEITPYIREVTRIITGEEHDGTQDMFTLEEIEEIADYLRMYCEHHKNGD